MSEIADFLRARYTAARKAEEAVLRLRLDVDFEWEHCYEPDDEYVLINGHHRVDAREFWQQYGEPAPDPDVIADLDAKLTLIDDLLTDGHQAVDDDWYTCPAVVDQQLGIESGRGGPCNCGRDARVNRRLALLAQPFAGHPDYKEAWSP